MKKNPLRKHLNFRVKITEFEYNLLRISLCLQTKFKFVFTVILEQKDFCRRKYALITQIQIFNVLVTIIPYYYYYYDDKVKSRTCRKKTH